MPSVVTRKSCGSELLNADASLMLSALGARRQASSKTRSIIKPFRSIVFIPF